MIKLTKTDAYSTRKGHYIRRKGTLETHNRVTLVEGDTADSFEELSYPVEPEDIPDPEGPENEM